MIKTRVVKILTYTAIGFISLVLLLWLLIQLPAIQNRLVDYAANRASTLLKTEVKIGSVDFSLFNKFSLNQVLVRDQKKDSLLYAGSIRLNITDWFFIKDNIRVNDLAIEDLLICTQRIDSIWNYRFIEKALSGGTNKNSKKQSFPIIDAATISIKRFKYKTIDAWRGEDQQIEIGELKLASKNIDLIKKSIALENVSIENQRFYIRQYKGNRPDSLRPKPEPKIAGQLYWNLGQWSIHAKNIHIKNGFFSSDLDTKRDPYPYFDGAHIAFDKINGNIKNLILTQDTIKAYVSLSTTERSGFEVVSLTANMHMDPDKMSFDELNITTPYSVLGDYFAMEYSYFSDDMAKFVTNVRLKGSLSKSRIDLRDIAFFAPQLKNLSHAFDVDAEVEGPVKSLRAKKMRVYFGSNTILDGSLYINGLPDVAQTTYELRNSLLISNAKDLYTLIPDLKKNLGIDLNPLGNFNFSGNAFATESDLKIEGSVGTALGSVSTIANLKNLTSTSIEYGLEGKINSFEFGKLLTLSGLGKTSGKYIVSGKGKGIINFNAKLDSLYFNDYRYTNLNARGGLSKKVLESTFEVDDENLLASLMAKIDFNDSLPRSLIDAQVHLAELQQIKLTNLPLQFSGKTKVDIIGNTPDNINGTAKLNDFTVFRDGKPYVFDSLLFSSQRDSSYRVLTLLGKDIDGRLEGDFDFAELPATLNQYFSNYYPLYFTKKDPPKRDQNLEFSLELKNASPFLKILDNGMSGLDYSKIEGSIDTRNRIFRLDANIPRFTYNKISIDDFLLNAYGDTDSLKVFSKASSFIINDSLFFPNNEIQIQSSKNLSYVNINTSSTYSDYGAKLSASVRNIEDGIIIHFNPSSLVFNEKTWNIDEDGELLISKKRFDAENILLKNGDQRISLVTLPAEANQAQTIILSLTKVNLGELLPFFLKEPKIQGITTGDLTIEDPFNNFRLYLNAQTDQTRFEEDSIGLTSINAFWDDKEKRSSFFLESDNPNYQFDVKGALNLKDSSNEMIETNFNLVDVNLSILEPYLGIVFSKIEGKGNGVLKITGNVRKPDLIGMVKVRDTKLTIGYSQCTYTLGEHELNFLPNKIDLGNMSISDGLGNTAIVKGTLEHSFFRKFKYDISASSRKLLVMNTSRTDNDLFYGKAIARFNFSLTGPESQMLMKVSGAPVDSSVMNILTETSSKQSADVDYIVWKTYGKEAEEIIDESSSNLIIDLDLTATPLLKMNVVLDELTGDVISGLGTGNLKIRTGTTENLSMIGRYNIESGSYNFNFQDIFKKPFRLLGGGSSYISWTGDPYDAEININALYLAEKVRMSTLFTDPSNSSVSAGVSSDLLREISDVEVRCNLSGTLNNPNPTFQIVIPQNSTVKNNSTIDSRIKAINRDPLEVSKQSTYLIVFKSFAPQAAIVANDLNNELINTTISGVINGILANSVQNFFSKMLGSTVDVNFNYSRTQTNIGGINNTTQQNNFRENVSLQFIKSYLNDNLIISFGSDFNFAAAGNRSLAAGSQSFLFLPDVNVEYKITPDGKFRTSFFYRSSFDVLSTSGKRDRTGGNVSFRTEFDNLFGRRKKLVTKEQ